MWELKSAGAEEIFQEYEYGDSKVKPQQKVMFDTAKGRAIRRPQMTRDDISPVFFQHYPAYKNGQLNISELARVYNLNRTTVYKYISLLKWDILWLMA